jgi:UDP-N-acetylglucosamine diphosphorylase / glucose-1-phosphate thymidylyltransferase / UDP-N-acetylgalactosamine diphosphorylase / glucosamine-1-phosphate N-acetyltransferase / galactosamine-1-phosphate N-acetyltransferase
MKNLTDETPKPMLKIKNKPILEHKLEALPDEIDEIIFIVGYRRGKIEEYFGNNFKGKKIIYIVQKNLNGTGGALHLAADFVGDKFLVMMGDDLYHKDDIKNILNHENAILASKTNNPSQFGVFEINEAGHLLEIVEKPVIPPSNLINTGLYALTKDFFNYDLVPISETEFGLPQTLVKMAQDFPIKIIKTGKWQPIGNPEELKQAEKVLEKFLD